MSNDTMGMQMLENSKGQFDFFKNKLQRKKKRGRGETLLIKRDLTHVSFNCKDWIMIQRHFSPYVLLRVFNVNLCYF